VDRHDDVPGGLVVTEIRLVNGKPLLRAGKLATADACCEQCDCNMDELEASGLTPSISVTFTMPAPPPCNPNWPPATCQCPGGAYTAGFDLTPAGSRVLGNLGNEVDITVDGVTVSVYAELQCYECEYILSVFLSTYAIGANTFSCVLAVGDSPGSGAVGISSAFPLESRRVDGNCVPKDTDYEEYFDFADTTLQLSLTLA
jgi:hypothetical protein